MHLPRTRFKQEIRSEFLPPQTKRVKGIFIIASGMPGYPHGQKFVEFLARKGYWVFLPRYRGTWESGGEFLKQSLEKDLLDIVDSLDKGFVDLWSGKKYRIKGLPIYIFGSSFGGPAAVFASLDSRIAKVVVKSGVYDWRAPSPAEPMAKLGKFTREAFGEGYRFPSKNWRKLDGGKFYNPWPRAQEFNGKKILMVHAKDDLVATFGQANKFAQKVGCQTIFLKRGGHLPTSVLTRRTIWRKIAKFITLK